MFFIKSINIVDMLKVSTRVRYGLRALLRIAISGKGICLIKEVARDEGISEKYLASILVQLKASGILKALRGAKGGYVLAKSPDKVTLLDIVKALEGEVSLVDCVIMPEICEKVSYCIANRFWAYLSSELNNILSRITLKDLIDGSYVDKS